MNLARWIIVGALLLLMLSIIVFAERAIGTKDIMPSPEHSFGSEKRSPAVQTTLLHPATASPNLPHDTT